MRPATRGPEQREPGSTIDASALESFRASFRGELVLPSEEAYERARRVWNGAIDKRPAVIARCSGVVDVVRAVEFGREHELLVAVRGGGHNVAGHGTCDGGIVMDLSPMRGISLDLARRTIRVQAGATWGDVDHETQAFGLATTGGLVSTTGIAGFTLGGGFGWLMRKHGLACDNLLSAEIVSAGGRVLRASADENADLFWGLRGGGGNFGIVTGFEFRLYPVGPVVTAGAIFFPGEAAGDLLRFYREWVEDVPDELTTVVNLATATPAPFLPEEVHGERVVVVSGCYAGTTEERAKALQPLDDEAIETLLAAHEHAASLDTKIQLYHFGGEVARVAADETAFGQRDAPFLLNIAARWTEPADDLHIGWARELHAAMRPFATGGVYVNFLGDEGRDRVRAAYGERTYARLVDLKRSYDPTNLFRVNQNIPPARRT